jgi:hypothetical protein
MARISVFAFTRVTRDWKSHGDHFRNELQPDTRGSIPFDFKSRLVASNEEIDHFAGPDETGKLHEKSHQTGLYMSLVGKGIAPRGLQRQNEFAQSAESRGDQLQLQTARVNSNPFAGTMS